MMKKWLETRIRKNFLWILAEVLLLVVLAVMWGFLRTETARMVIIVFGLCSVGRVVIQVPVYFYKKNEAEVDPEGVRRQGVEEGDERNIMIRDRSGYQAFLASNWILGVLALVFLVMADDLRPFFLLWGIQGAQLLIFYALKRYNNQKL